MSENGLITLLANKSGLAKSSRLLRRANELHRLVQSLGCLGPVAALGASASSLAVVCLHLAAEEDDSCSSTVATTLTKLSGIKSKAQYVSLKENVSTALGVNKPLSVEEVCVKLGCTQNRRYALDLLDLYAKNTPNSNSINLKSPSPLFACAAVGAACRVNKASIDRNELASLSRSKRATLLKVIADILEIVKSKNEATAAKQKGVKNEVLDLLEDCALAGNDEAENENRHKNTKYSEPKSKRKKTEEDEVLEFEEWRKEMLRKAGKVVD